MKKISPVKKVKRMEIYYDYKKEIKCHYEFSNGKLTTRVKEYNFFNDKIIYEGEYLKKKEAWKRNNKLE